MFAIHDLIAPVPDLVVLRKFGAKLLIDIPEPHEPKLFANLP